MAMTLDLPPEVEQLLRAIADRSGNTVDSFVLNAVLTRATPAERRAVDAAVVRWLDSLPDADDGDDDPTALDAERPEGQKLFPPEMKGVTW